MSGRPMQFEAEMRCSFDVAQNALDKLKMRLARIMHEQAHLLNGI
jgi:hypothetical protein